ncbi:MAG: hypothetical protein ABI672_13200 [Vicinamibacteria bacterium]
MRRRARAGVLAALALLLAPTSAVAGDFWKAFLAGAASGFIVHESAHLTLDIAFAAQPRLKGVHFGSIPFFAVTHRNGLPERREAMISGAGFFSQHVWSEVVLSRQSSSERISAFSKGALAFHVATSVAYAGAAFSRYGPYERDTRGIADSTGSDERLIGTLVLAPAVFDTWRYLRPHSRTAKWGSRLAKIAFVGVIAFKD